MARYFCLLIPDNYSHIAGKPETRKRKVKFNIIPALQANPGTTQLTYIIEVVND